MAEKLNKKREKKKDIELLLSIFFIVMGVFVLLLTTVTILRVVLGHAPDSTTTTTAPQGPITPPTPTNAIFTGGKLEKPPHVTSSTVDVTADIKSNYAVLIDASSGEILAQKSGHARFNPASMTKVMTLIVACEYLTEDDLSRKLQLSQAAHDYMSTGAYAGASTSFIKQSIYLNDFASVKDALYAIGIASAADATYLICVDVAGSEAAFVDLMNQKADTLGLTNTHFDNAIGHESEHNYTTAADMAAIMAYALQCDLIRDILSYDQTYACKVYRDAEGTLYPDNYHWYLNSSLFNTNPEASSRFKAYKTYYEKDFELKAATFGGGKTGTLGDGSVSDPWIYSLVSYATQGGKTYIAVTGETNTGGFVMRDAKVLYDNYIK